MEELGLNPSCLPDCLDYDAYLMAWEDAEINQACAEEEWEVAMYEQEAAIEDAVEHGEITEEAGKAACEEIEQRVVRFRVERGYDRQTWTLADGPDVLAYKRAVSRLYLLLRVRAVHAQRGATRQPRTRVRSTAAASRDGPRRSSDDDPDPPADRLADPLRREVAA